MKTFIQLREELSWPVRTGNRVYIEKFLTAQSSSLSFLLILPRQLRHQACGFWATCVLLHVSPRFRANLLMTGK